MLEVQDGCATDPIGGENFEGMWDFLEETECAEIETASLPISRGEGLKFLRLVGRYASIVALFVFVGGIMRGPVTSNPNKTA